MSSNVGESSGGWLVSTQGQVLPLQESRLAVEARGGVSRTVLTQRFKNPYEEPLRVLYKLALPADGAVAGFAFTVAGERISGVVEGKAKAKERFERALVEGRSAALLSQERSSLFSQEVGNVPPGQEVLCEVTVDQKLAWLDEGAWEWRFPTVVAPRYMGHPGRVPDAAAVSVPVADGALTARASLTLTVRDALAEGARPESPSHALDVERQVQRTTVTLGGGSARLDRDVVVRWRVAAPDVGVFVESEAASREGHGGAAHGLVTLVPPSRGARLLPVARDLILLLDTSGSMGGEPLAQARAVAGALIDTLTDADRLELVEFSNEPRRWKRGAVQATAQNKQKAHAWLQALEASGGTEMRSGILEALAPLSAETQRQVVLVTDGQIGFEREVVEEILHRLPPGSRVHTVGVGSAVNRSLTGPAARAGRGVEAIIGLGEDPERAARRLVARSDAPQVVGLTLTGSALVEQVPARLPDLYAGAPALLSVKLRPEGGELRVSGRTADGSFERTLRISPASAGNGALAALFARERVEDLEMELAAGAPRRDRELAIERLGVDYQISTRLTSWVAVSTKVTVDATAPIREVEQPQELPHGMSVQGLGLRGASASLPKGFVLGGMAPPPPASAAPAPMQPMAPRRLRKSEAREEEGESTGSFEKADLELDQAAGAPAEAPESESLTRAGVVKSTELARGPGQGRRDAPAARPPPAPNFTPTDDGEQDGAPPLQEAEEEPAQMAPEPEAQKEVVEYKKSKAAPAKARGKSGSGGGAPWRARGSVLLLEPGLALLAVPLAQPFAFDPARAVLLHLADGRTVTAQLKVEQSTRGGQAQAGLTLRLAIVLPFALAPGELRTVVLSSEQGELTVEL